MPVRMYIPTPRLKTVDASLNNELLREEQSRNWQEENRAAIDDYNRRIEAGGVFSDGLRHF